MKETKFGSPVRRIVILSALLGALLVPIVAQAQSWPQRPVRVVVPAPAGGAQDVFARALTSELTNMWGQQVLVENRAGGGSIPATEAVVRATPDGYTILQMESVTTLVTLMLRTTQPPYDFYKDLVPVAVLMATRGIFVASPKFPANNLQEVAALARARPGQINYGSFGVGSIPHIDTEAWAAMAGVTLNHVPYRGGAPLVQALMQDEVSFAITAPTPALPLVRDKAIKPLAYLSPKRSPLFPDVPTVSEQGYPFESLGWFGWMVPTGTPQAIVEKVAADVGRVISAPAFVERFITQQGNELINADARKFREMMESDAKILAARTAPLNLKLDF